MARVLRGVGVSPGVAVGRVHVVHAEQLPVVPDPVPPERVAQEVERFEHARDEVRERLRQVKDRVFATLGDHYAGILEAQLLILDDPSLVRDTVQRIRVGRVSARWALKEVIGEFERRFQAMDDAYLRERGGDLSDVHLRLQRALQRGSGAERELPEGPLVVVAHSLAPSDAIDLARRGVVGLATDVGGRTSHTAILAQALGVPAVAGLRDVTRHASPGDAIVIDGATGIVELLPDREEAERATERHRAFVAAEERALRHAGRPATTRDGVHVALRANLEFASDVASALRFGAEGIGLYRSEFLFLSRSPDLPDEEEHYRTYVELARAVRPHPAVVRTLDLGGEKYFHEVLERDGGDPVLGLRAIRFCLHRPDVFRPQLRGLLRAAVEDNLRVLLPLVTDVDEVRAVRRMLHEEARSLAAEGVPVRADVPLGVMIEVPAAAMAADLLAEEADFLSLGTNDLIQYALAVDRGNESVNYLYRPLHPGVLRMLRHVVDAARRHGLTLSVCGEMAADPAALPLLIGLGLSELSVQPRALPELRERIAELDARESEVAARRMLAGSAATRDPAWPARALDGT